ncbi:sulfurtransferase [Haloarcula laminariae]|uniref:sulfurtransferase n=1 Tax=Haloarcula laminariae TaxID=2961577 RepID=UPI0021C66867|nr:rhodanese-like domain-containing protein [Halomicroarcula laminariae]
MTEIFVSPQRVSARDDLTVVDVRREWDYANDHIPGAVHVPFERFRDSGDAMEGTLPTPTAFGSLLGGAGIEPRDRIVAYDGGRGVYASRLLVTAEVLGHDPDRLHLMDGDIRAWRRNHETTDAVPDTETAEYVCEPRADGALIGADELEDALDSDAVVVDTRDPVEYDTVHLPGAVNLQWRTLVDDETRRLRPRDELESILQAHGLHPDRPVRLYCNTGRRLSFVYTVLLELGYEDIGFYEGGIEAWAEHGGPVETTS